MRAKQKQGAPRIARGRLNIRFGHCTSCLFDNSSVKLCKHDTPFHSCRKARMMSRVWGRHAPTRSLRKCRRIEEVKSRWSTTFSRIENLWPRDGSCPLPLRSKSTFDKCFRIVKAQKISKRSLLMYGSHRLLRTKFLPLFVQRRWLKSRYPVRTAHEIFKVRFQKRKIPPTQYRRRILSG